LKGYASKTGRKGGSALYRRLPATGRDERVQEKNIKDVDEEKPIIKSDEFGYAGEVSV